MASEASGMSYQTVNNLKIAVLTQSSTSTDTPEEIFDKLEKAVLVSLTAHITTDAILAAQAAKIASEREVNPIPDTNKAVIKAITDNFQISKFTDEEVASFHLDMTQDVSDITSALVTKYSTKDIGVLDSYSYNIGTSSTSVIKSITIDKLSSLYQSNINISLTNNTDIIKSTSLAGGAALPINLAGDFLQVVEDPQDPEAIQDTGIGPWTASFDSTNSNTNYIKAVNSEYNNYKVTTTVVDEVTTTVSDYNRPMKVEEYNTFNRQYALGMDLSTNVQHYYTLDTDGKPNPNNISNTGASSSSGNVSASLRLHDNGISAVKNTAEFSTIAEGALGSYRVQSFPEGPSITKTADTDIRKFPVSNGSTPLPLNTLTIDQLKTAFGSAEVPVGGYQYIMTVTEVANSGYSLDQTTLTEKDATEEPIFSLDNSSLKDNPRYMENYVNGAHTLTFNNSTLAIQSVGGADTDNLGVFSLNGQREYLTSRTGGEIKLNTRTPLTRHNVVSGDLAVTPNVYYNTEGGSLAGISNNLKTNNYAAFLDQLVMQNTKDIGGYFMKHDDVTLDLFNATSIVNSNFNTSDFEFTATGKTTGVAAEVIRITSSKQLSSVNGFSKSDLSSVSGIFAFATLSNLKTTLIGTTNVFDKAQMLFNLKSLDDSKIKTSATAGWSLTTADTYGKMVSSSASAFASDSTHFPSLALTKSLISNSNVTPGIDFKISVLTDTSGDATQVEQLRDEVKIEYWVTGTSNAKTELIIPQELLTKTQVGSDSATFGTAIRISASDLSGKLSGKTIDVYPVTAVKNYKYACELPLRGFTGLTMTTPTITSTTSYYIIKDAITSEQLPSSFHQYINVGQYKNISEEFSTVSSVSGTFDKNDLCDMLMKVVSKDTDVNVADRDLTSVVSVSMYYGIDVKVNLNSSDKEGESSLDGDITLRCECDYSNQSNAEDVVTLNDNAGYLLKLTNKFDTNFSCDYWSNTLANITTNTNIASTKNTTDYKKLSIQNGYSSITTWNSTSHKVVVTYADNKATTILSIQNATTNTELYKIKTKNFTYLNTQAFISNVVKDIHRVDSWLGTGPDSVTDNGFVENFIQVDYTNSVYEIHTGVYLSVSSTSPFTLVADNGKYYKFSLLQDQIGVNLIGSVSTLSNINNFTFQYVSGNFSSQILTIGSWYRGYYGPGSEVVQVYTISRTTMSATLTINRSTDDTSFPLSISQSWNVYADNDAHIVNNLSSSVGDIGLKITFYPSMLASSDPNTFSIYTRGDAVELSVLNPNAPATSYRLPTSPTTLKTFNLDTFGGSNFNSTYKPLSLISNRLKIKSSNSSNTFTRSTVFWKLEILVSRVRIYKNNNYLGNPEIIDTNDPYVEPNSTKWTDVTPAKIDTRSNYFDIISATGITINGWKFTMDNSVNRLGSISYYIIAPPYQSFSMIQTNTKSLPCVDSTTDLRTVYLPVSTTKIYNPFTATKTYTYSDNNTTATVTNSQDVSNNVTFTTTDTVSLASFTTSSSKHHFVIEGSKATIKLRAGFKSAQTIVPIMTLFNDYPVNRLTYLNRETSPYVFYKDSLTNSNSGITMKLFQVENAVEPASTMTSEEIFDTQRLISNVSINYENFFILPSSSIQIPVTPPPAEPVPFVAPSNTFAINLPTSNGSETYLYTRETSTDQYGDHVITLYRYNVIDDIDLSPRQVYSGTLIQRSQKTITIPKSAFIEYISTQTNLTNSFENFAKDYVTNNTFASGIHSQVWTAPASWGITGGVYNSVTFSIVTPSDSSQLAIPPKFFSVDLINNTCRAVFIQKNPILTAFNTLGLQILQITADGTIKTPSISTTGVTLSAPNNSAVSSNFSELNKKTISAQKSNNLGIA